jgi:hypothetical protein
MTEEVQKTEETISEQNSPQQPTGPDLNITDLAAVKSIIEVASQRGAFKAAELESVGKIYNKLSTFLEAVSKKEQ